jgi:hypothetical protein
MMPDPWQLLADEACAGLIAQIKAALG